MKKIFLTLTLLLLITCSKDSTEDNSSVYVAPPSNTTNTTTTPTVTQYTLTVTAGSGGSVSTAGGTYNDGTSISISATPNEGYGFVGWNGSNSTSSTISVTLTANTTIEALFGQLPQLTLPDTPSKMFTKGVGDTLSIGFSHAGGYKTTSLSAEYGSVSVISEPNEGDTVGNIVIEYTVNTVENVDRMTTIAGFDDIEISISGSDDLTNTLTYQVRSQPEPIYKDYLKPSHDLVNSRVAINPALIRFLNEKDNSQEDRCQYVNGGLNQFGNLSDDYGGIAFADVNGDGYDDMLLHPVYTEGSANSFSTRKVKLELYLYEDGEYVFSEMDFESITPELYLVRKLLIGDYDNDGDPDFFAAAMGIDDGLGINTEKSLFIINNFNINGTFSYKEVAVNEGSHSAASGDIDNDGDLDIFQISRLAVTQPYTPFLKNIGNFELESWSNYITSGFNETDTTRNIFFSDELDQSFWNAPFSSWHYNYFNGDNDLDTSSELIDVNKDGYIDLIVGGNEWTGAFRVIWGSENGYNTNNISYVPSPETPASFPMGHLVDIKVYDLNQDGINEIILNRTGGGYLSNNENLVNFYDGWYIQVLSLNNELELIDITDSIIEDFYSDEPEDYCGNLENNWIYWLVIDDYDNNGNLDIYNRMMSNRPLHRWEWNGSKFSKID